MGHTVLIPLDQFERDVLAVPRVDIESFQVDRKVVSSVSLALRQLFSTGNPTEAQLARKLSSILSRKDICGDYTIKRSEYKYDKTDRSKSKVDAAMYPKGHAPKAMEPDWTHCRIFIEFKSGGTSTDPFDDFDSDEPEAAAGTRAKVLSQIISYAYTTCLYQHREYLYSLLINGCEFRVMRWDRSGVIASKKVDYVKEPARLLKVVAYIARLTDEEQGLDPTVTLLDAGSAAYKLMDRYAEARGSDMSCEEFDVVFPYTPPRPSPSGPAQAPSQADDAGPGPRTRSKTLARAKMEKLDEGDLDSDLRREDPDSEDPRIFKYVRDKFRESLRPGWPRYKITVGATRRVFLVGEPIFPSVSMFGRGTRGYVALDPRTRQFVFLKDSWRPFYKGVEQEGYYLEMLSGGSPQLRAPTVVCHGDVGDQETFASRYASTLPRARDDQSTSNVDNRTANGATNQPEAESQRASQTNLGLSKKRSWDEMDAADLPEEQPPRAECKDPLPGETNPQEERLLRHHRHYRIVVADVCLPFNSFKSSHQLIRMLYDCIITHQCAYEEFNLLHRDVSAGNLLIRPELNDKVDENGGREVVWYGILTDWELAKVVPEGGVKQNARQPERTGTWQFMSVAYVRDLPMRPVMVADELESFFHVFVFYGVRHLRHNLPDGQLPTFIINYFDNYLPKGGNTRECSILKSFVVTNGKLSRNANNPLLFYADEKCEHKQLNSLLGEILKLFRARYEVLDWKERMATTAKAPQLEAIGRPRMHRRPQAHNARGRRSGKEASKSRVPGPPASSVASVTDEPPRDVVEQAELLDSHQAVVDLIYDALDRVGEWPEEDAGPDKLPGHYEPRLLLVATAMTAPPEPSTLPVMGSMPDAVPPRKKHKAEPQAGNSYTSDPEEASQFGYSQRPATDAGVLSFSLRAPEA